MQDGGYYHEVVYLIRLQERRAKVTKVFKALNNFVDIPYTYKDLPRSTKKST